MPTFVNTATANGKQLRIIRPLTGWAPLDLEELWRFRELLYFLTWRDIKVRYKQTFLGILWAFIQPFLRLVVFSVIFGKIARLDSAGYPYPIFLYSALLPWQFFSEALSRSSTSIVGNTNLVTKVYFPRLILPLSSAGACLVDFFISFSILLGLMIYYDVAITWRLIAVLPLTALILLTTLAFGIWFSSLCVTFRDFRHLLPFVIQMWMYVTPVVYGTQNLGAFWKSLLWLNPVTGVVAGYRAAVLSQAFDFSSLAVSTILSLAVFLTGLFYFRKTEAVFADLA